MQETPSSITVLEDTRSILGTSAYRSSPTRGPSRLLAIRRWFGPLHAPLVVFFILSTAFLVAFCATGRILDGGGNILVSVLVVGGTLALTYGAAVAFLNRTELAIRDGWLTVRHGPLPALQRDVTLPLARLQHVSSHEEVGSNEDARSYAVIVWLRDGGDVQLFRRLGTAEEARFLALLIASHL